MKKIKLFISFILVLLFNESFAQFNERDLFLNEINQSIVDSGFSFYYLDSSCLKIYFDKYEAKSFKRDLSAIIPDSIVEQLFLKSSTDTLPLIWNIKNIVRARSIPENQYPFIFFGLSKSDWSDKKKEKEIEKQYQDWNEHWDSLPPEEGRHYSCSRPIFDYKKEYALIQFNCIRANSCSYGCTIIFQKVDGSWLKIHECFCWQS